MVANVLLPNAANPATLLEMSLSRLRYGGGGRSGLDILSEDIENGSVSERASLKVSMLFSCFSVLVSFRGGIRYVVRLWFLSAPDEAEL